MKIKPKYFMILGHTVNTILLQSENNEIYALEIENLIFDREIN